MPLLAGFNGTMRYLLPILALLAACTTTPAPHLPDGKNRVVDIVNTFGTSLHFTARASERRGLARPDPIEGDVRANYYLTVNFNNGSGACLFDLRAAFENGEVVTAKRFDTCAEVSWVVAP